MNPNLDILFVNPCANINSERLRKDKMKTVELIPRQEPPHMGMGYLLSIADKEGINADYIDMSAYEVDVGGLLKTIEKTKPSVVGFSAFTVQVKSAAYVAEKIKEKFPEIKTCLGGPHATAIPKESLIEFPSFDFIVNAEADNLLLKILNNLNNLTPIPGITTRETVNVIGNRILDLDALPFPAWNRFDLTKYPGSDPHRSKLELPMASSRGCPFTCNFCARMFGRKRINRSVESVIAEMERNIKDYGATAFYFLDETFIAHPAWNEQLFKAMIDRGINKKIKWSCSTRVDIVTPEMFKLMRKSGCYYVFFGFEHGDDEMLKIMGKKVDAEQARRAVKWAKAADLVVVGCFILGLPGETLDTAYKNIHFAKSLDIYSTSFPIACPYPGTLLRSQAEKHEYGLKILTNNWDDYGKQYPGVMESDTINIDTLRRLQKEAYEFNPKKKLDDYEKPNTYE
jgi:anaerobic magnesium-protoporphyrin IX monomethyl ester cyclase